MVNSMNVLVATPGRLLQHMDETPGFDCSNLQVRAWWCGPGGVDPGGIGGGCVLGHARCPAGHLT